ncbi:hypothetical protein QA055_gp28 [Salmonella phage CTH7]|uniref:Uncharacterized protein n=1 Tax=Salmonella phage CTH7 TaxID=2950460 RepID=A0A9E7MLY5_9CAUD|nr:hypothetical protein QA055_gp28 [Salmonella phage CTH7]URQ02901.1 hypothetical protein [Salmonella phage PST-H1]USL89620.1 hypothetical protein [Salmonella phage nctD30]USL89707.1 hypothetical protein [Salmonella phage pse-D34]UTQ79638.1 hypothetical protein [Salmonella phage NCTh5]USL89648.1 hypothetical protein [Salmonella phage CTH7]
MGSKDELFEYLIDQLRQQVNSNPYKQQCEDLAHEVLSLKNQLRDASAQIKELHLALVKATGDVEAYKLIRKGGYVPEQSGCRKEDVQGCEHEWVEFHGLFIAEGDPRNEPGYTFCRKCGLKEYSRKCGVEAKQ